MALRPFLKRLRAKAFSAQEAKAALPRGDSRSALTLPVPASSSIRKVTFWRGRSLLVAQRVTSPSNERM